MATETQIEVVMPQMGVSVSEGTITKWLKQEGEPIAARRVAARDLDRQGRHRGAEPGEGVVAKILVQEGETVEVGTVLAVIAPEGAEVVRAARRRAAEAPAGRAPPEPATQAAADASEAAATETAEPTPPTPRRPTPAPARPRRPPATAARSSRRSSRGSRPSTASTRARCQGTGAGGRVTKKDILAFVEGGGQAQRRAPQPPAAPAAPPPAPRSPPGSCSSRARAAAGPAPQLRRLPPRSRPPAPRRAGEPDAGETFEPMTAMRKGIAEHMRRSLDTSAHVTSAIEVDMSKVVAIRAEAEEGVRGGLRRQPDLPLVRRAGDGRDAARVPVDQRRDPRRQDRHAQLRQPRLRRRARRRQGPDRPGREARARA